MCPILIFSNILCLLIKITHLIELWPLNLSVLFGLLPVDYSFSSWKLSYVPKYLVLIRQVYLLKVFLFLLIILIKTKTTFYLYNWLCKSPYNIFYQLQIPRPMQWFAQCFRECVNHPTDCVFGIVLALCTGYLLLLFLKLYHHVIKTI